MPKSATAKLGTMEAITPTAPRKRCLVKVTTENIGQMTRVGYMVYMEFVVDDYEANRRRMLNSLHSDMTQVMQTVGPALFEGTQEVRRIDVVDHDTGHVNHQDYTVTPQLHVHG